MFEHPKKLRIGPMDYEVHWMNPEEENEKRVYGEHSDQQQVIRLTSYRKRQRVAIIFKHEVNHALLLYYGNGSETKDEEDFVGTEAVGWAAFVRDNKEAVEWMNWLLWTDPDKPFILVTESTKST